MFQTGIQNQLIPSKFIETNIQIHYSRGFHKTETLASKPKEMCRA